IMKPVYRHQDGTFGAPDYLQPKRFVVAEGLLGFYTPELRDMFDVRVYLDPAEALRRHWKSQRDCQLRAETPRQVPAEPAAAQREERSWEKMRFAQRRRTEKLG